MLFINKNANVYSKRTDPIQGSRYKNTIGRIFCKLNFHTHSCREYLHTLLVRGWNNESL